MTHLRAVWKGPVCHLSRGSIVFLENSVYLKRSRILRLEIPQSNGNYYLCRTSYEWPRFRNAPHNWCIFNGTRVATTGSTAQIIEDVAHVVIWWIVGTGFLASARACFWRMFYLHRNNLFYISIDVMSLSPGQMAPCGFHWRQQILSSCNWQSLTCRVISTRAYSSISDA